MIFSKKSLLSFATIIALSNTLLASDKINEDSTSLGSVDVVSNSDDATEHSNSYTINSMSSATKMNLSILDTPQSVSVITQQQMRDFDLNTINEVLNNTTGIEVEQLESDRTRYTSRGFNITNFLVDGVGSSNNGYIYGDMDMFLYDHIEVTRGATGLTSNHGDPSATINMVRKRPTKEFQASTKLSGGSWSKRRIEGDVSGALNESKTIRTRILAAYEKADSYLDRRDTKSTVLSAMIDGDINDNNTLTFGLTRVEDKNNGSQHGGFDSRELQEKKYDISINPSSDWSYRNTKTTNAFLELESTLSDKWKLKSTYSYNKNEQDNDVANLDPGKVWANIYADDEYKTNSLDFTLNGAYSLFDREHEIVLNTNYTKQKYKGKGLREVTKYPINLSTWDGSTPPRNYDPSTVENTDYTQKELSFTAATNFHIVDNFSLLVGSKIANFEEEGMAWNGAYSKKDTSVLTPYLSLVYKITDDISTYVSYTTTFNPQNNSDEGGTQLDAEEGINYEVGFKSSFFDGALNSSFALFKTEKENVAEEAGKRANGDSYYRAIDGVTSKGFEVEVSGDINETINTSIGYTSLSIKDAEKKDVTRYIPRRMLNASITYSPREISGLKVGVSANWKSKAHDRKYEDVSQKSYVIYNLMTSYKINKNTNVSFNVNNLTDERYFSSLMKGGYTMYGAPRSYGVSLEYRF
ncbi:MAG: TonB-dependent siderophore receptor [Arcobacter sp.]|uniref:TonB-dependent siderophore receptor n=1 Tax=Arcobacter sp. TaxID=1872629 RepID=UPI003C7590FE